MGHGPLTINETKLREAAQQAGYEAGAEKTGEDLFARFHKCTWKYHPQAKVCPGCGVDCYATAIVKLLYVHIECDCREGPADYRHLVEQIWHIKCYVPAMYAAEINRAARSSSSGEGEK